MGLRVTMAWELGGGGGHVGRLGALALGLEAAGHGVTLLAREGSVDPLWWGDAGVAGRPRWRVQAGPWWLSKGQSPPRPRPPRTWADILVDGIWFGGEAELLAYVQAWERALQDSRAQVVVTDYAPTVVLAARRLGLPTVSVSCGFSRPPDVSPLPDMRKLAGMDDRGDAVEDVRRGESLALTKINPLLPKPLMRLASLYDGAADVRCTFAEIDHFGASIGQRYLGTLPQVPHEPPTWPGPDVAEGPAVFAYLKKSPVLPALLGLLTASRLPVALFVSGSPDRSKLKRLCGANVCLHDRPLDIERAASTAELCVCHAGHGTVSVMLRAGVPMLLIPLHLEQALVARRTETLGAAVVCRPDDPEAVRRGLQRLLIEPGYTQAARRFAKKYDQHDTASALRQAVQIVEEAV